MNKETLKRSKNVIKILGKTYYSFVYMEKNKKSFNKADFIVVGGTSYYLPA